MERNGAGSNLAEHFDLFSCGIFSKLAFALVYDRICVVTGVLGFFQSLCHYLCELEIVFFLTTKMNKFNVHCTIIFMMVQLDALRGKEHSLVLPYYIACSIELLLPIPTFSLTMVYLAMRKINNCHIKVYIAYISNIIIMMISLLH